MEARAFDVVEELKTDLVKIPGVFEWNFVKNDIRGDREFFDTALNLLGEGLETLVVDEVLFVDLELIFVLDERDGRCPSVHLGCGAVFTRTEDRYYDVFLVCHRCYYSKYAMFNIARIIVIREC